MKAPQIGKENTCTAKVNKETGWVEVFMPDGERIPFVRSSSLHTDVSDPAHVKLELFVKVEQD